MKSLLNAKLCCSFCLCALALVPALGQTVAVPVISTTPALHGAVVVSLSTTTPGAAIWYATQDSYSLQRYDAPFLVDSRTTLVARASVGTTWSSGTKKTKLAIPKISPGTLVWEDEFSNSTGSIAEPNPNFWTYDTGNDKGWGNKELEYYCAWNSSVSPCNPSGPSVFVKPHGGLAIVAQNPSSGVYTSARIKTQGLFSFQYGRIEVRAEVPEAQGFWPAFWLLGNSISTVGWPACGEQDVLERVDAALSPDWNQGSIHGTNFTGSNLGTRYSFPSGQTAATWHIYGMIWKPGIVAYYVDDPAKPYVTYTPASLNGIQGAVWPFDWSPAVIANENGQAFIIINLAIGGTWPGSPDSSTPFPSTMLIDYVRIYKD